MPYFLRKAPNQNLYWVVSIHHPKRHLEYEPITYNEAKKQIKAITLSEQRRGKYY